MGKSYLEFYYYSKKFINLAETYRKIIQIMDRDVAKTSINKKLKLEF